MSIACNECNNDCSNCKYDYLCEYRMKVSDNVPVIQGGLYVGDTTKRDTVKSQLRIVK